MRTAQYSVILFKAIPVLVLGSLFIGSTANATQISPPKPVQNNQYADFTPSDTDTLGDDTVVTTTGTYFRPPANPSPLSGPSTSTGTRRGGCLGTTKTAFTLLGPDATNQVVGLTTSDRPAFTWYLPEADVTFPVIFRLLSPDEEGFPVPLYEAELTYMPGFVVHQIPDSVAALPPSADYRWQVIIECNPEYPARALVQERAFEVVRPTAALSQALTTATTDSARAIAYGQATVWYDAIATVAQATTTTDRQTRQGLLSDLAASLPETKDSLRQDILAIISATSPTPFMTESIR